MEVAAETVHTIAYARLFEARACARGDGRQVEQLQLQRGVTGADEREKDAFATTDVEQTIMLRQVVRIEYIMRHRRQGRRHDLRMGRNPRVIGGLRARGVGVRPVARQLRAEIRPLAQQRDRIGQVVVRHLVMLDERRDPDVAHKRCPERAQTITAVSALHEKTQRDGRIEQAFGTLDGRIPVFGDFLDRARTAGEVVEEIDLHAGVQRLRVDKSRHEIEHLARPVARDGCRERKPWHSSAGTHRSQRVCTSGRVPARTTTVRGALGHGNGRRKVGGRTRTIGGRNGGRGQRLLGGIHSRKITPGNHGVKKSVQ